MRSVLVIAIVLTVARPAWADNDGYRAMAGTGLALTIGGGIAIPVGLYFAFRTCAPDQEGQPADDHASDARIAKWTIIGGLGSLAVGIPLLAVGHHLLHLRGDGLFSAWVAPSNGGVMAGVTVRTF